MVRVCICVGIFLLRALYTSVDAFQLPLCSRFGLVGRQCTSPFLARTHAAAWTQSSSSSVQTLTRMVATVPNPLDDHLEIDTEYPGLKTLHKSPDVYLVEGMLSPEECDDIIASAQKKDMQVSPVAYAGWSEDAGVFSRLLPIGTLPTVNNMLNEGQDPLIIAGTALAIWAGLSVVFWSGAYLWAQWRTRDLQQLRTSTSVTLDGTGKGDSKLVLVAEKLLKSKWKTFEAPTVIHYAPSQVLAPHFDANRGAAIEDATRGGQTIATLLVYLNDVTEGGKTSFGRLGPLEVNPQRGCGLLFFPATADGEFDERVEHEGCKAIQEKWIARIWRHENRVQPPYGLADDYDKRLI